MSGNAPTTEAINPSITVAIFTIHNQFHSDRAYPLQEKGQDSVSRHWVTKNLDGQMAQVHVLMLLKPVNGGEIPLMRADIS